MTSILGISAFYHDSAAALVVDGDIVAAAQEERFSRIKNDAGFPSQAIAYCLQEGRLEPEQLDYVVFYDKPFTKFERLVETYLAYAPSGLRSFNMAMPRWLKDKLFMRRKIKESLSEVGRTFLSTNQASVAGADQREAPAGWQDLGRFAGASRWSAPATTSANGRQASAHAETPILFTEHHESHAASAFFPSPFDQAAILTLDGVGEWSTTTMGVGDGNQIKLTHRIDFPHSLGLLYSAFTYYCGFKVNHGEYKLMGLAPYGQPRYVKQIYKHLVDVKPDGSYWLNMDYFNYCQGLTMTNGRFDRLFGGPPRKTDAPLEQRHMDLAASVQVVTEEVITKIACELHRQTGMKKLVLAGGVALNCVANGKLLRDGPYDDIWIQPAAGDSGGALGAALFVWHQLLQNPRNPQGHDSQKGSFLGPRYETDEIEKFLRQTGAVYHKLNEEELLDQVAGAMAEEKIVGWFHGRMEFGPRALGARSIIGDARSTTMQSVMNLKIKFRESFRPFAPCVLREHVHDWFDMRFNEDSPYMLLVAPVKQEHRMPLTAAEQKTLGSDPDLLKRVNVPRSAVPAITHVDYSARVQTVDERHGRYQRLMKKFHEKTGCPVIVNTSFNLSWEPIVLTPQQAYHTFMQSEMDVLVLEDCVLFKREQPLGFSFWATPGKTTPHSEANPWADPRTGEPLVMTPTGAWNPANGRRYPVEENIPRLFVPTVEDGKLEGDVTDVVKQFYEKTPFPNYEDLDNMRALLEKARTSMFARLLNEQIPYDARVVEVGCGTGQLSNFLAIAHRSVLGVDLCLNSLRLAHGFKTANALDRVAFAQMNLFRPALRKGGFDFVISNGVLHHTGDPKRAFQTISELARPGGHVIVGLYNSYSRRLHYARRTLFRLTGLTSRWLDPHFGRVGRAGAEGKHEAWFRDQYCHPHESCHTLDEVLGWMDEAGLEFVNSIPKPVPGTSLSAQEQLFEPRGRGSAASRILSQLASMGNGYREGGFFIMIGRRKLVTTSEAFRTSDVTRRKGAVA